MSKSWLASSPGRLNQAGIALLGALTLWACRPEAEVAPPPAWPEEEPPEYPGVVATADPEPAPSSTPTAPATSSRSASPLASTYSERPALQRLEGQATYYADSLAGNKTASGERYRPGDFTAAHRTLPFGTVVRVTRTDTQVATYVKINDRGPFGNQERVIDLSKAAASDLGMLRAGVVPVRIDVLEQPAPR